MSLQSTSKCSSWLDVSNFRRQRIPDSKKVFFFMWYVFFRHAYSRSTRAHLHLVGMLRFMLLTKINRACPLFFILFLCLFLSMVFSTVFHSISSPDNSPLSHSVLPVLFLPYTLFFRSYFCLTGPFNYISLYKSLRQPWFNPLWLTGLKTPTN